MDRVDLFKILFFLFKVFVCWLYACLVDQSVFGSNQYLSCRRVCQGCLFVPCNRRDGDTLGSVITFLSPFIRFISSYLKLGQWFCSTPFFIKVIVFSMISCDNKVSSCWIEEYLGYFPITLFTCNFNF